MSSIQVRRVALSGRSGAGKTTIAKHLASNHGFRRCSTGVPIRELATKVFGQDAKQKLNLLAQALDEMDPGMVLRVAMSPPPRDGESIVVDSVRTPLDFTQVRQLGFVVWHVEAPSSVCHKRLTDRGQAFEVGPDDEHPLERGHESLGADMTMPNYGDDLSELLSRVDEILQGHGPTALA